VSQILRHTPARTDTRRPPRGADRAFSAIQSVLATATRRLWQAAGLAAFLLASGPLLAAQPAGTGLPVDIFGEYRLRHEGYSQPIGIPQEAYDEVLVSRLLLGVRVGGPGLHALGELLDSRTFLDTAGTPIGTDDVNAVEPLQLQLGWDGTDVLAGGDTLALKAGRMTIDAGSRRLVARNRFRNTINGFTGIHAEWYRDRERKEWFGNRGHGVQAFLVMPIDRLPNDRGLLAEDSAAFDAERTSIVLGGLRLIHDLPAGLFAETYLYRLWEQDAEDAPTRDRRLYTPGLRLLRKPQPGHVDFEIEAVAQLGHSRATAGERDRRDLIHRAGLVHVAFGYTPERLPTLRTFSVFDYATGDGDPNDGVNERFDSLYGARRFDFGPTGIYGLLARSNLISPGLFTDWRVTPETRVMVSWRANWLAAERDSLGFIGLRDRTGRAGSFFGHQIEVMGSHFVIPKQLELESGVTFVTQGEFLRNVRGATEKPLSVYTYLQATLFF